LRSTVTSLVRFTEALPKKARTPEQPAAQFIALIAQLYAVESRARELQMDASARLRERQQTSVPVLARIEALLLTYKDAVMKLSVKSRSRCRETSVTLW
jgi:ABC-type hemin transport system substrate-binding protein